MRSDHIHSLGGASSVIVLADSDDAGRRAARARSQRIADADAKREVRLVDLYPDRTDGSDVSDWLADGHTRDELAALVEAAPRVEQSPMGSQPPKQRITSTAKGPAFTRAATLLAQEGNDGGLEYVVDNLLPLGGTAILAGRPKGGKSTLALNLALSVARGESFLGRSTRKGTVLYLALEGARGAWTQVLRALGVTESDDLYLCIDRAPDAAIQWLRDAIAEHQPTLVVVDTMQRLLRVKDGNDYATGSNATDAVIELARTAKAGLVMVHHSGKTRHADVIDEVMGSTAWAAAVDTVVVLRKTDRYRTLTSEQRIGENLPETVIEMGSSTRRVQAAGTRIETDLIEMKDAIEQYLRQYAERNPDDATVDEPAIKSNVEGRNDTKPKALRELVTEGRVGRAGSGKRGDPYRYQVSRSLVPEWSSGREKPKTEDAEKGGRISADSRPAGFAGTSSAVDENPTGRDERTAADLADPIEPGPKIPNEARRGVQGKHMSDDPDIDRLFDYARRLGLLEDEGHRYSRPSPVTRRHSECDSHND
jgi:5S rRNA maturation endonuclease (ribonuclease M5)